MLKKYMILSILIPVISAFGVLTLPAQTIGELSFSKMWVRASPPAARVAGAYIVITNYGLRNDMLLSVSFSGANKSSVHEMKMTDGVMAMRPIKVGVVIPSGKSVSFKPGLKHLMLMGLKSGVAKGSTLKITLGFERAGNITLDFPVMDIVSGKKLMAEE